MQRPPYSYKVLTLSSGKNPIEPDKDVRFPKTTYTFNGRWDPRRGNQKELPFQANMPSTYRPTTEAPRDTWMKPAGGRGQGHQKWKKFDVKRGSSMAYRKEFQTSKQVAYHSENYKGKNSMSRSQWGRLQKKRKAEREAAEHAKPESSSNMALKQEKKEERKSVERKLFSP